MSTASPQQPNAGKRQPTGDYVVGYCQTPEHTRFKPGHKPCGGRRRGSLNLRAEFERAMKKPISVRTGNNIRKMPVLRAMLETHAGKAAQGDDHSMGKIINLAAKFGYLTPQDEGCDDTVPARAPTTKPRPSDGLVESVDRTLLSRQEQAELAKLAEVIDRDGDVILLSDKDLLRLKEIISKGRGKDVPPPGDDASDQAA